MVKKKYRRVGKKLYKPIPGSPALYQEEGGRKRYSDIQIDSIQEKRRKRK